MLRPSPLLRLPLPLLSLALLAACQSSDKPAGDGGPGDASTADATSADAGAADASTALLPDLTVNLHRARVDMAIRQRTFAADACELDPDEACIAAAGTRKLLHFSVETPNIGNADMVLGPPDPANDQFQYSTCHEHYHFLGYAEYRLIDSASNEVATGRKQAFCLLDSERYVDAEGVATSPMYNCQNQGIQRGWSDVYYSSLPCQFIDVTDVPDGTYTLEISINNGGTLPELTMNNNLVTLPVELGGTEITSPTEACPADAPAGSTETTNRECGWTFAGNFACTPGQDVHVGCSAACGAGFGSCTGDPMLRVCDADRPDGNCSFPAKLGSDDDSCGSQCPLASFTRCPASGNLAVYTAPFSVDAAFTCDVEVKPAGA